MSSRHEDGGTMHQGGRLSELQDFAARGSARQILRGSLIRALGSALVTGEELLAIVATVPRTASTVTVVTSERVLIAHQPTPQGEVTIEAFARSSIGGLTVVPNGLAVTKGDRTIHLEPLTAEDRGLLESHLQPPRRRSTHLPRTRRPRRAVTDLQMIEALLEAGVLTEVEHEMVRTRLLARMAAHDHPASSERPSSVRSSGLPT